MAVNITVLNQINVVLQEVAVEVLIAPVHAASDADIGAIYIGSVVVPWCGVNGGCNAPCIGAWLLEVFFTIVGCVVLQGVWRLA